MWVSEIGDSEKIREWAESPGRARELVSVGSGNLLSETSTGKAHISGDRAVGGVEIPRNIEIGNARDRGREAIGETKALHQPINPIDNSVGVDIKLLLHQHRFAVGQAVDLKRNGSCVQIADPGGRNGKGDGSPRTMTQQQTEQEEQHPDLVMKRPANQHKISFGSV